MELPFAPMHFNIHGQELLSCTRNLLLSLTAESFFYTLKVEEVYGQSYRPGRKLKVNSSNILKYFITAKGGILI